MPVAALHFSISGEFITEKSRDLWEEGDYKKAMDVLGCLIGSTREQHISIIEGRKKLIGTDNVNLVDDEWTPPEGYATFEHMMQLATGGAELEQRRMSEAQDKARRVAEIADTAARSIYRNDDEIEEQRILTNQIRKLLGREAGDEAVEKAKQDLEEENNHRQQRNVAEIHRDRSMGRDTFSGEPDEPDEPDRFESADRMMERMAFAARFTLAARMKAAGLDPTALATPDAMLNRGYDKKPEVDHKFENINGWVLPNGKFYGFGSMEHAGQAAQLLPDGVQDPEQEAEARGWIKLSRSISGFHCVGGAKPTKKQFNTLFDYAQKHGRDYEEMIQHLPE